MAKSYSKTGANGMPSSVAQKVDEQKIREQVAEDIVNLEGEEKSIREILKLSPFDNIL